MATVRTHRAVATRDGANPSEKVVAVGEGTNPCIAGHLHSGRGRDKRTGGHRWCEGTEESITREDAREAGDLSAALRSQRGPASLHTIRDMSSD